MEYTPEGQSGSNEAVGVRLTDEQRAFASLHLGLVYAVANKYTWSWIGLERDDAYQYGMFGLFKAVQSWTKDRGVKFAAYAVTCIRNEISQWSRRVRCPSRGYSINHLPIGSGFDDGGDWFNSLISQQPSPGQRCEDSETAQLIWRLADHLSPRHRQILLLRFGHGLNNHEIAATLKISHETVKLAKARALRRLRDLYAIHEAMQ